MGMKQFHAVMIGEDRMEFGHTFEAENRSAAYDYLDEMFPESRVDQLEDAQQTSDRERRIWEDAQRAYEDPHYYDAQAAYDDEWR